MKSTLDNKLSSNSWKKQTLFFVGLIVCFAIVFSVGYSIGENGRIEKNVISNFKNTNSGKPDNLDFSLFWEAWSKLSERSVQAPDLQKMLYGSISGMLSSMDDPYTVFFSPEDNKRFREDIQGEFDGIGVELVLKNGLPTVVAPLSKSPADQAGIKAGDVILAVDEVDTSGLGFNETVDKIRGPKGSKVRLRIFREGSDQPVNVEVTRETISIKSVEWEYRTEKGKKIAIVHVRQFGDDTDKLFDDFVSEIVKTKPAGIIVDLRNNPGGYLESAINLSSYFLDGGIVVNEKGRSGDNKSYNVTKKNRLSGFRTAVLVNNGSASASEIFAGALQDRKSGRVFGEKTFGKGSVQEIVQLSDGSALKITVAKWYTPTGRSINGEGITPDVEIKGSDSKEEDSQLDAALEYVIAD
ncbi:MAG: S41 family peptidase [Patescibacteria group bacterium]